MILFHAGLLYINISCVYSVVPAVAQLYEAVSHHPLCSFYDTIDYLIATYRNALEIIYTHERGTYELI